MSRFPGGAAEVANALIHSLDDEDREARLSAVIALKRGGGWGVERVNRTLLALIDDPDPRSFPQRVRAAQSLCWFSPELRPQVFERLITLTTSKSVSLRRSAIESLEHLAAEKQLTPGASPAEAALERALKDEDRIVRCLAASALSEFEGWDTGRALACLIALDADTLLPAKLRDRARWAVETKFADGSGNFRRVYRLREIVAELKQAEAAPKVVAQEPDDQDPIPVPPG